MGAATPDFPEKNEVEVERIQNVADNGVLGILPAAAMPAEFAHLDEKKILRKVFCSTAASSSNVY